jgi:serine/threonine protein kinase
MKGLKQIKNYRLTREIGKGATATVYEAVDDTTNKIFAVKSIASSKLQDKRVMENFKRELKLLHGLNHPNIIKVKGVEKTVNNIYLILEYCNGGNLYEYSYAYRKKNNAPLPEKYVQKIIRQLIEGLEYMHKSRTVHRDVKLENILIDFKTSPNMVSPGGMPQKIDYKFTDEELESISIKIADLGYARELEGGGVASTICGTPITMAPDIINLFDGDRAKDHKYNNKVDLWSLGAITYELIVGRPPFYASNYKLLFEEVMNGKYTLPKNLKISIEAITFINGLLQFFPEKRMSWEQINDHPFIKSDVVNFTFIDLKCLENNYQNPQQLEIDTKDCENFVWLNFKTKTEDLPLDKIDQSIYQNPIIETIKKEFSNKDEKSKDQPQKEETSEDDYESAANEINLGDDDFEIEKYEKNKEERKSNKDLVHVTKMENKSEIKNINLNTDNQNQLQEQEEPVIINEYEHSKPQENVNTSNRVFDRIFSEMKQELKSSKLTSVIKDENKILNKSQNESKKEEGTSNISNVEKNSHSDKVVVLNIVNNSDNNIEVKSPILENFAIEKEEVVNKNNLENFNNSNRTNQQEILNEKNTQEFIYPQPVNNDCVKNEKIPEEKEKFDQILKTQDQGDHDINNNNFLPEPPKEFTTENNVTKEKEKNKNEDEFVQLNEEKEERAETVDNQGNLFNLSKYF